VKYERSGNEEIVAIDPPLPEADPAPVIEVDPVVVQIWSQSISAQCALRNTGCDRGSRRASRRSFRLRERPIGTLPGQGATGSQLDSRFANRYAKPS
jgi:hypothetical protein